MFHDIQFGPKKYKKETIERTSHWRQHALAAMCVLVRKVRRLVLFYSGSMLLVIDSARGNAQIRRRARGRRQRNRGRPSPRARGADTLAYCTGGKSQEPVDR